MDGYFGIGALHLAILSKIRFFLLRIFVFYTLVRDLRQDIYVKDLKNHVGKDVTLRGWLYNRRSSGKIQFLELRDGTGICQCVVMKNHVDENTFALYDKLKIGRASCRESV